jgi:cytochrome c551/c552
VVPDNFVLSDQNIAECRRMPNRNGMTLDHACGPAKVWAGNGKPDVKAVACMKNCEAPSPRSPRCCPTLPAMPTATWPSRTASSARSSVPTPRGRRALHRPRQRRQRPAKAPRGRWFGCGPALLKKNGCTACHGIDNKIVGPGFRDVAKKYAGRADAVAYLTGKIKAGGTGVWGAMPHAPAGPARGRCEGHRPVAGRRRQEVNR